ncbi:MAG: serine/threonine-protein kinase [Myxococcota bacterium]|nr:serine/threonine-protein kinase [Myxococcota bacterium]
MGDTVEFGRYRIKSPLGKGGMAEVLLAAQVGPSDFLKPCVLKRIHPEHLENVVLRKMFEQEARISALLNHPNIVQTFDYGEIDDIPFMAMELVEGLSLSAMNLKMVQLNCWWDLRSAIEIALAICRALAYAHALCSPEGEELRLVHRDVSPQNILISKQGTVKLADFGIARATTSEEETLLPGVKGKIGYMAPEQYFDRVVDARSDLFSLGILLAELSSGRRIRKKGHGLDYENISERIKHLLNPHRFPEGFADIILSWTELSPNKRPESLSVACEQLEQILANVESSEPLSKSVRGLFGIFEASEGSNTVTPENQSYSSLHGSNEWPKSLDEALNDAHKAETESSDFADHNLLAYWDAPNEESIGLEIRDVQGDAARPSSGSIELVYSNWQDHFNSEGPIGKSQSEEEAGLELKHAQPSGASLDTAKSNETSEDQPDIKRKIVSTASKQVAPQQEFSDTKPSELGRPNIQHSDEQEDKKSLGLAIGLFVAVLVVALFTFFSSSENEQKEAAVVAGSVKITSEPNGARIFLNGRKTNQQTPAEVNDLPLDVPITVELRSDSSVFESQSFTLSEMKNVANLVFKAIASAKLVRLETNPKGAKVKFNFLELSGETPLELPPLSEGKTATISISKAGFVAHELILDTRTLTSSLAFVTLESVRQVVIQTNPPGAEIYLNNKAVGLSPTQLLEVPSRSEFFLRAELPKHDPYSKKLSLETHLGKVVQLELSPTRLDVTQLTSEQRNTVKKLEENIRRIRRRLKSTRSSLRTAETNLNMAQSAQNSNIQHITQKFRSTELIRVKAANLSDDLQDALSKRDRYLEDLQSSVLEKE